VIAECRLRLMIVGGIVIALLGLASIAAADVNAVATYSGRLAGAAASHGIPMDFGSLASAVTIPMDYGSLASPATLQIDPDYGSEIFSG
jgi:hypothetical protein